jgi:predicted nucleotidyltransferase
MKIKYSKEKLKKIGKKYNLRFILVYGSYASGDENKLSDLDVAIHGKSAFDFKTVMKIHLELSKVFGNNEERELDLVDLKDKDPLFTYQIMKNSYLLYGNRHDYYSYQAFAMRNYLFNKKMFDLEDALIEKSLQNI